MVMITNARQAESVQSLWHCLICRRMWKFLQLKSGCFVDSHHIFTLPACQLSEWVELSSPPLPASPRLLSSAPWPRSRLLAGLVSSSPRVGRHLAMMNAMLGTRRLSDVLRCSEWRVQYSETACTTTTDFRYFRRLFPISGRDNLFIKCLTFVISIQHIEKHRLQVWLGTRNVNADFLACCKLYSPIHIIICVWTIVRTKQPLLSLCCKHYC